MGEHWRKEARRSLTGPSATALTPARRRAKNAALFVAQHATSKSATWTGTRKNTAPQNLFWTCRRCNVLCANALQRAGIGRKTRQYNPQGEGAKTLGQWLTAVTSMKGESDEMPVDDAVAMIHATPPEARSRFAKEIWRKRRAHGTDRRTGKIKGKP